jgi:hypothetical protein
MATTTTTERPTDRCLCQCEKCRKHNHQHCSGYYCSARL